MIVLHSTLCPVLVCPDASLAVQSEKRSTLISEILKRFTATGVMPNAYHPSEALDPMAFPPSFVEGANLFTEKKEGYHDEDLEFSKGIERDLDGALASLRSEPSGDTPGGEKAVSDGDRVSELQSGSSSGGESPKSE